jgi:CO/xanthine dehydrogenase Mo-binding subunit
MVHVGLVLSPIPHGQLRGIDPTDALAVPGVLKVLTASDIPGANSIGCVFPDQPLLATDRVRFVGDRIALVLAASRDTARQAAALVKLDLEPLPGVFDARQALEPDAPKLFEQGNLLAHLKVRHGQGREGFADADVQVEEEFQVNYQEHAYLEPQGALALLEDGAVTIHGSMQCPFYVQEAVARVLGLDLGRIRVVQAVTGGAFGGKEDYPSEVGACAALASWHTGRPAKLVYSRKEDMQVSTKRHRMFMKYRLGARRDGTLVALEATLHVDAGGYAGLSTVVAERSNSTAAGPYRIPHAHVDTLVVYTNNLFGGAFRGFGNPQVTFAMEGMIERLAQELGMDPATVRRMNLLQEGDVTVTGQALPSSSPSVEVLDRLVDSSGLEDWRTQDQAFNQQHSRARRGSAVALSMYGCCLHAGGQHLEGSGALLQIRSDGSVEVTIGGTELGQGAFTMAAQMAADALGAPYPKIRVLPTDTSRLPDSGPTVASRTTVMSGNAVLAAARPLRTRLNELAGTLLFCDPRQLKWHSGVVSAPGRSELSFEDLVREATRRKVQLSSSGWYAPPPKPWNKETGQGTAYVVYCFSGHAAHVEVNLVSGLVRVLKLAAVHDVGKAIHPDMLEAQAQGGMVQGMGWALSENLQVHEGRCLNPGFSDYLIPGTLDIPEMDVSWVESPYLDGPFGAKGVGEPTLISVPTAVALAVGNACGRRPTALPVTAETVLRWTHDRT